MPLPKPKKPVVLTCVQPSGKLHLGNYLGAIHNWLNYLNEAKCYFGIADLHTLTSSKPSNQTKQNTLECIAQYIACGLDPKQCFIFLQSQIVGHTELAWILACQCGLGQLERMTQFKDKAKQAKENTFINAGLLYYPILMAADILLYNANKVPVGEDQNQHLELTRDLAQRFNQAYSETFYLPSAQKSQTATRIASLKEPTKKMSKSDPDSAGTLFLTDSETQIKKKIMSAVTDSGKIIRYSKEKPGIANLLTILSSLSKTPIQKLETEFKNANYREFKLAVAERTAAHLAPIQERYKALIQDPDSLLGILNEHQKIVQKRAFKVLNKVKNKVGLL